MLGSTATSACSQRVRVNTEACMAIIVPRMSADCHLDFKSGAAAAGSSWFVQPGRAGQLEHYDEPSCRRSYSAAPIRTEGS